MIRQLLEQLKNAQSLTERARILAEIKAYVMQTGPRGGKFYYAKSGRKIYRALSAKSKKKPVKLAGSAKQGRGRSVRSATKEKYPTTADELRAFMKTPMPKAGAEGVSTDANGDMWIDPAKYKYSEAEKQRSADKADRSNAAKGREAVKAESEAAYKELENLYVAAAADINDGMKMLRDAGSAAGSTMSDKERAKLGKAAGHLADKALKAREAMKTKHTVAEYKRLPFTFNSDKTSRIYKSGMAIDKALETLNQNISSMAAPRDWVGSTIRAIQAKKRPNKSKAK